MKIYSFSVAIMLLLFASDWQEITSFEGKFRIYSPGEFKASVQEIETTIGTLELNTFAYADPGQDTPNFLYMVSFIDYPNGAAHSDSLNLLDEFFETSIATSAESVSGEVLYQDKIEYGKYPGRFWRVDYAEGKAVIKAKAFLIGNRYYSIQTAMVRDNVMNGACDKFMDSFKFLDEAAIGLPAK